MKPAARLLFLAAVLVAALLAAVRLGAVPLSLRQVVDGVRGTADPATVAIVRRLRLPRALLSALVGGSLAASGATFQALLRNPLAEPYILGISGGAAVGAVLAIALGGAVIGGGVVAACALAGAVCAILLVFRIAAVAGRALDTRVLLLAGVVAGAFFNACILLTLTFADPDAFRSALFWIMGSFAGATGSSLVLLAAVMLPALAVLLAIARALDLLEGGEETAAYLGTRVERTKGVAYATASLLTAASVAVSGVIGFVGLVVPHVVRMLWGPGHRFLIPASVLLGAAFMVFADTAARTVAAPTELPVGVVTAFVGVPFFVYLLRRRGG